MHIIKSRVLPCFLFFLALLPALACAAREAALPQEPAIEIVPFEETSFIDELCAHTRAYDSQFIVNFAPSQTLAQDVEAAVNKAQATRFDYACNVDSIVWNTVEHENYVYSNFKIIYDAQAAPRPSVEHFSALDWPKIINAMLMDAQTSHSVCIPAQECTEEELVASLQKISEGVDQALFAYFVEEHRLTILSYEDYIVPTLYFDYREGALSPDSIYQLVDPYEAAQFIMSRLSDGEEPLTLRVQRMEKEKLQLLLWTAQINDSADMVEEALKGISNYYESADDYIAELSIQYAGTQQERESKRLQLKNALNEIEAEIRADMPASQEELYEAIALAVASRAQYDQEMSDASIAETLTPEMRFLRTAYGALCDGRSVCTSYSAAYKALCDRFSLPCWVMMGDYDGAGHAWNCVLLNGEPRYADLTFFDMTRKPQYLLFSQAHYEEQPYTLENGYVMPDWYTPKGDNET